jgi:hypothetical protein
MKKIIFSTLFILLIQVNTVFAQKTTVGEKYGNTLNLGVGIGYYGYVGHTMPVVHVNFEFDVAKNFTLAPFITFYSYEKYHYWGNQNHEYRNYYYRQSVIPVGVKGTYYFDGLLKASGKWDFYLGGSLGFAFRSTRWESDYYGETTVSHGTSDLYFDGHVGAEYHFTNKIGLLLDLSSGISTLCLAIHL